MPKIEEEIYLNCNPETAFLEISDMDFVKKINPNSGLESKVLFHNNRFVRYKLSVKNVGEWESERVIIPESLTIVTQRRKPIKPFFYMTVLHVFKKHKSGTILSYIEEFEMDEDNKNMETKVLGDILKKINPNLKKIEQYFNGLGKSK
mgnify:CR=1 FL=1